MTTRRPLLSLALLALLLAPPLLAQDLARDCDAALQAKGVTFGAQVVELGSNRVVFEKEGERPLVPASNMKVLTTAAALALLGPDFAHETKVMAGAPPQAGVIAGPIIVVGSGDPTIARRFDADPLLSDWAEALWQAGVRRIAGDVVADDRAFDGPGLHPDWDLDDAEKWYGAEVGALELNDGCVDVSVRGAAGAPKVELLPSTSWLVLDVQAGVTANKKQHVFSVLRAGADKRTLRVTGKVWTGANPQEANVPVRDPGLFLVNVLLERLEARGIVVDGVARRVTAQDAALPHTLFTRKAPLLRTLDVTNQRSQNLYAECLLKTLGRVKGTGGTWSGGAAVSAAFARQCGAAEGQVVVRDGSGLSREDRLSARALVAVLKATAQGPNGQRFRETLATPEGEGTLASRLHDLAGGVTVYAKTGTLTGVSALSGYLVAPGGAKTWMFSIIGNGPGGGRAQIDAAVRRLSKALAATP